MKKTAALLLASLLLLSLLGGCKNAGAGRAQPEDSSVTSEQDMPDQAQETQDDPFAELKEYRKEDGPRFDMPDDLLQKYQNFVMPFNVMPEEFEDPGVLSDFTLIFTSAAAIQVEFIPSDDGISSRVPLSKIESRIREYFGPNAKLSDSYKDKDYSPYEIDSANGFLVQYFTGNIGGFFLPYALIEVEGGCELWLIDLMDPLFFDDPDNQEYLLSGGTVSYDEIASIALQMQYNVYRIEQQSNGRLLLAGFRYENYKDINHFLF